jgi:universal stress protein A
MEDIKRILVACTMTRYCTKAIRYGFSLAKKYEAELYVLRVVYDPFLREPPHMPYMPISILKKDYEREVEQARQELSKTLSEELVSGRAAKELIREGEPRSEILKIIKDEQIDLLVLLAYEEGRLEHFLFGRGVHDLVRRMPCSIFLVKKELEPVELWEE